MPSQGQREVHSLASWTSRYSTLHWHEDRVQKEVLAQHIWWISTVANCWNRCPYFGLAIRKDLVTIHWECHWAKTIDSRMYSSQFLLENNTMIWKTKEFASSKLPWEEPVTDAVIYFGLIRIKMNRVCICRYQTKGFYPLNLSWSQWRLCHRSYTLINI